MKKGQHKQPTIRKRKGDSVFLKAFLSTTAILVGIVAVVLFLGAYLLPVVQVSGDSMAPTYKDGDILLLLKTDNLSQGQTCCISWQNKILIKRVIGLPGDVIDIDDSGNVTVNGQSLSESYLIDKSADPSDIEFPFVVPEDRYFVMGDKRGTSIDSRCSVIGCIDEDQIVGRVLSRIWPF